MTTMRILLAAGFCCAWLGSCTHHVEVEPVHITIDVNVKLDRAVEDYFGEVFEAEDQAREESPPPEEAAADLEANAEKEDPK